MMFLLESDQQPVSSEPPLFFSVVIRAYIPRPPHPPAAHTHLLPQFSSLAPTSSVAPPPQPERPSLYGIKIVVVGQGGAQVQFLGGPLPSLRMSQAFICFLKSKRYLSVSTVDVVDS